MAIEIRQLSIKSFVTAGDKKESSAIRENERQHIKEELLAECKQMVRELIRAERER